MEMTGHEFLAIAGSGARKFSYKTEGGLRGWSSLLLRVYFMLTGEELKKYRRLCSDLKRGAHTETGGIQFTYLGRRHGDLGEVSITICAERAWRLFEKEDDVDAIALLLRKRFEDILRALATAN